MGLGTSKNVLMAAREVVRGVLLAGDELLRVEELAVGARAHLIETERTELIGDDPCGADLPVGQLGMLVQIAAEGEQLDLSAGRSPIERVAPTDGCFFSSSSMRRRRILPIFRAFASRPSSSYTPIVASAVAHASGWLL